MKVSDFIGQKVIEIVSDGRGTLIVFENRGRMLVHDEGRIFYDEIGDGAVSNLANISFSDFFNKLTDKA